MAESSITLSETMSAHRHLCAGCEKFNAVERGFCSVCSRKRKDGLMTMYAKQRLRSTPQRAAKFSYTDIPRMLSERVQELYSCSERIENIICQNPFPAPLLLNIMEENDVWLDESTARTVMALYHGKPNAYQYQHILGCRIIDSWNMYKSKSNIWNVAICYYTSMIDGHIPPHSPNSLSRPSGIMMSGHGIERST